MKLSIALAAAFAGSAAAVYSPPQPKGGQDIMSLWMQLEAEAVFMQNEIALKRTVEECKEDCNIQKEENDKKCDNDDDDCEKFNRGRCQKNCEQLDDNGDLDDDGSGNRNARDDDANTCDQCCSFGDSNGVPGRRQFRCLEAADCDTDFCVDGGRDDDDNNRRPRGSELFYKGICGDNNDDDTNFANNFCDDSFTNNSDGISFCRNPKTNRIGKFCDWLESNNKSFSNRDYEEGMCDRPSNSDQDFCDDIDDELCDKNENKLSNSQISLCDWLNDTLSSKKTEAAARLSKIAPVLRAGVKK